MRVIAGEAKGHPLKGPPKGPRGEGTRPTSDKVKGAIFSMLEAILVSGVESPGGRLSEDDESPLSGEAADPEEAESSVWAGKRILDLYAGTGALGIEGLSRGAQEAVLVDSSQVCQRLIRENLRGTGLANRASVVVGTLPAILERSSGLGTYDLALLDPPYGDPSLERVLAVLGAGDLLAPEALVVVEHSRRNEPAPEHGRLRLLRRRRHGDTEISIYRRED